MELVLFAFIAALTAAAALGAIAFKSPLYCAFCLLVLGVCAALLFVQLEAAFLAVAQVFVAAGGVLVLLLLAISTMDLRQGAHAERVRVGARVTALLLGLALLAQLALRLLYSPAATAGGAGEFAGGSAAAVGRVLASRFALPLEIGALLLLAAIVGLLVLAGRQCAQLEEE